MLAIRLQRVGRKGYATYRVAIQEAQRHPSSGRVIAYVGSYNPHSKETKIDTEKAQKYLDNGAQPTPRVVKLLKEAGVKLPKWVKEAPKQTKPTKNAEKLRKNRPAEAVPSEEVATEEPAAETAETDSTEKVEAEASKETSEEEATEAETKE